MTIALRSVTIFGMVIYAENALQALEAEQRQSESAIRKAARLELSRKGIVPTETAIAQWRQTRSQESATHEARAEPT